MPVGDLAAEFSTRFIVPVDVDEVVEALRARGVKDQIWFWPVEIESEKLRGALVQWERWDYPQGEDVFFVADIHYAASLPPDWQRLVCCKELLHILDADHLRADTRETVAKLIEKIILPPELQDPLRDGATANGDRSGEILATALLFPLAAREVFLAAHQAGKITVQDIAKWVDIPERYVALAMSDTWPEIHDIILSL